MKSGKQRRVEIMAARQKRAQRRHAHNAAALPAHCIPSHSLPVNMNAIRGRSWGLPDFAQRGYYLDRAFCCKDCSAQQVWTARQQQWWYEAAGGDYDTVAVRCKACRMAERARKADARQRSLAGLQRLNTLKRIHHGKLHSA